jgi:hypothetical protein
MSLDFTFSGHETFPLRISWLPKAVSAIEAGHDVFGDVRNGMAKLGLGKNMIKSLEFWVQACGLATKSGRTFTLNPLAKHSLSRSTGADPFLERFQTLWLLHWHLCQGWQVDGKSRKTPYAWKYFSSELTNDETSPSEALESFKKVHTRANKTLSDVTLLQHYDIFVKTYVQSTSSAARATPEDALDSPLTSLGLLKRAGERRLANGKRENVYLVDNGAKPSITDELIRYATHSWWDLHHGSESSATMREIASSDQSPGKVFHLPEISIYEAIKHLSLKYPKEFQLRESQNQRIVTRSDRPSDQILLNSVYSK